MKKFLHALAHLLRWNMGRVEDWRDGDRWMLGFRCNGCGRLFHVFEHGNDREGSYSPGAPGKRWIK